MPNDRKRKQCKQNILLERNDAAGGTKKEEMEYGYNEHIK
jgi:hypothetical protein